MKEGGGAGGEISLRGGSCFGYQQGLGGKTILEIGVKTIMEIEHIHARKTDGFLVSPRVCL
jgi:hypothetical protein